MRRQNGFTLIELMVTIAIIGIVAGIAYPSYLRSMQKGRRADAKGAITQATQAMERCYSTYGTYNNALCPEITALTATFPSTKGYYTLSATESGTSYTVSATAVSGGPQANDNGCTVMNLSSTGQQSSGSTTSTTDSGSCW
ncbi:MAG TPA: type IV pilin protein [Gammaproteobacteria bacterium]